ncbi:MAG: retron St85 family RNA-directed DNA polymerase [Chitinophagales bacterium]|nr:retron St85 family RNA-directed DNA polymerase [Chitinophagales bacterium]
MSKVLSRQEIYDRIRNSSKDYYILEEMKRLGFWKESSVPTVAESLIQREALLNKELQELIAKDKKYQNQELMLREMRKKRMKEAKEKREETKQKNERARIERSEKWKKIHAAQIIYLGDDYSAGLNNSAPINSINALLPTFSDVQDLAAKMGIDLSTLRFLSFHRKVSKNCHYHSYEIKKKSGGTRNISVPKGKLKKAQHWVLQNILNKIEINDSAHGFIKGKSIVTNAQQHVNKAVIINLDLKDFFPTIHYKRVKGLFIKLGYPEQLAIIFSLLCTHAHTEEVFLDGIRYYVQNGERFLPQGSPASPAISNLICYKLDKRLDGLAKKYGAVYSRYADDITFSLDDNENISKLLFYAHKIIEGEDLQINKAKTHIMRKNAQQKVTGIVVNQQPTVERRILRKFRALLHNILKNGWQEQKWGNGSNLLHSIEGYINYIHMVHPTKAQSYRVSLKTILEKHGTPEIKVNIPINIVPPPQIASTEEDPKDSAPEQKKEETDWWNLF